MLTYSGGMISLDPSLRVSAPRVAPASNWWPASAIAAWQPKGAASLAASYINLVSPGTHDAIGLIDPSWDDVNGWYGFSTSQTVSTMTIADGYFVIALCNGYGRGDICGVYDPTFAYMFGIQCLAGNAYGTYYEYNGESSNLLYHDAIAGDYVVALAKTNGYFNGVSVGSYSGYAGNPTLPLCIGNRRWGSEVGQCNSAYNGKVKAFAICPAKPDDAEILRSSAAMAAL